MVKKSNSWLSWLGLSAVVVGVVLYAAGAFSGERIAPGDEPPRATQAPLGPIAIVQRRVEPVVEHAVGTIASRRRIALASQLNARVERVDVVAGASVRAGQVLAQLDDRDVTARSNQARQALAAAESAVAGAAQSVTSAEANAERSNSALQRATKLAEQRAATLEQLEAAQADSAAANAGVAAARAASSGAEAERERAEQAVREVEVMLGFATIASPIDGIVAERSIEPGELAWPGRTLLVVVDPQSLRVEARVREGLVGRVALGQQIELVLDSADLRLAARVAEILPVADPRSRSFEVRAEFEAGAAVRPGMFGRLAIPAGEREVVVAPASAVQRVGQLDFVVVEDRGAWSRRAVTLGASLGAGEVEVLSGLRGGERIASGAGSAR